MPFITTKDSTEIFYKDWGSKDAQPIVFHHGWPLSADDWDNQLMFFLNEGFRVVAHDRLVDEARSLAADELRLADRCQDTLRGACIHHGIVAAPFQVFRERHLRLAAGLVRRARRGPPARRRDSGQG